MLLKNADDKSGEISELDRLLQEPGLTDFQRRRIEKQRRDLEKGAWGEQNSAYFLNFYFAESKNHLLFHDLRFVLSDGRTAQIDHLLVNRCMDIYVLESKNWRQLHVDETGKCTIWAGRIVGVESPLEQCRRHVEVLDRVLRGAAELDTLVSRYRTIPRVLVSPQCHLKAPHHEEWYVKSDTFYSLRAQEIEAETTVQTLLSMTRLVGREKFMQWGNALAEFHTSDSRNWRAQFGLSALPTEDSRSSIDSTFGIEGLAADVSRWGTDWFVLPAKPTSERKNALYNAGFRAKKENGEWVWRRTR